MAKSKATPSKGATINLKKLKKHIQLKFGKRIPQSKKFLDKILKQIKMINSKDSMMRTYNKLFCVSGDQKKYLSYGFAYYLMLFFYLTKAYPYEVTIDKDDSSDDEKEKKTNEIIELSDDESEDNQPKQKPKSPISKEQAKDLAYKDKKFQMLLKDLRNLQNAESYERLKKNLDPTVIELIDKVKKNEYNYEERIVSVYKTDLYSIDLRFINGKISLGVETFEDKK